MWKYSATDRPSSAVSRHVTVDFYWTSSCAAVHHVDTVWTLTRLVDLRTVAWLPWIHCFHNKTENFSNNLISNKRWNGKLNYLAMAHSLRELAYWNQTIAVAVTTIVGSWAVYFVVTERILLDDGYRDDDIVASDYQAAFVRLVWFHPSAVHHRLDHQSSVGYRRSGKMRSAAAATAQSPCWSVIH